MSKLPPIDPGLDPVYLPYGRKSHPQEKKDQKQTEREQREGCLAFVQQRIARAGRGELAPVAWDFDDDTGLNAQRPAYQRRLADVRRYRAEARQVYLVVRLLDRLGRDPEEMHRVKKELDKLGARVLAVDFNGEIADEVFPYLVANAHVGSLKIKANVKRINDQLRRDGWWRPGRVPWGYKAVPTTPEQQRGGAPKVTLALDEEQAGAVREAFARVAAGEPVNRVARWVATLPADERGWHASKDGPRARTLAAQELRSLLRAPVYVAEQPDGTPGVWPALVDRETWEKVQTQLAGAASGLPHQASGKYLLTGLLWCPDCKARGVDVRMRGWLRGGTGTSPRYLCASVEAGARAGKACYYSVLAGAAERDVKRQVAPLVAVLAQEHRADVLREVAALLREPLSGPAADVQARLAAVQATIDTAKARRRVLTTQLADQVLSPAEFTEEVAPYRAAIAAGEAEIAALAGEIAGTGHGARHAPPRGRVKLADVAKALDQAAAHWQADTSAEQRDVLKEWVERVYPRRDGYGAVTCHIEFTEEGQALLAAADAVGLGPAEQPPAEGAEGAAAG